MILARVPDLLLYGAAIGAGIGLGAIALVAGVLDHLRRKHDR